MAERKMLWWNGEDLLPFFEEVANAGAENVRIEYHFKDENLYVVPLKEPPPEHAGHNFNHTCPPDCPNGD